MPTIYSPSSRDDYSFCPRKWWLRKAGGWRPKRVGYPELCAIGGTAVSAAMASWNTDRLTNRPTDVEHLVALGLQSIVEQMACLREQKRMVTGLKDGEFLDDLPKHVEVGIRTLWEANPLKHHRIIAAEHEFKDFGNARPDVISSDPEQNIVVDDYKCKFGKFDKLWLDKEFDKHWDGEQRLAYTQMAGTDLFGIILVVIRPHSKGKMDGRPYVERRVSRVLPYEVALWRNDAALDYERMAQVEQQTNPWKVPGKVGPHATLYGECEYRQACVELSLDTTRMATDYVQIERTPHAITGA